jgi:hypothetical protein
MVRIGAGLGLGGFVRVRLGRGRRVRVPRRWGLLSQQAAGEEASHLGWSDDDLDLVGQLVRQGLLDEQWVLADEAGIPGELLGGGLARHLDAVGIGLGELAPGIRLAVGLDAAGLGLGAGLGEPAHLGGLCLQPPLFDLLLLEGEDVAHGLGLGLGGDDLLAGGGLGGLLAADLLRLGAQRGLLDLLLLEVQRVAHLLGAQLLGQERLHALAVLLGQVHVAQGH